MDFDNTTVSFRVSFSQDDESSIENVKEIIKFKLEKLKNFLVENNETYGFKLLVNDKEIRPQDSEAFFNDFLEFLIANLIEDDGFFYIENPGPYASSSIPDLEDGEMQYENSFFIDTEGECAGVFVTMVNFYASELERLPNKNIGISCEMVDIDGDYYEFDI